MIIRFANIVQARRGLIACVSARNIHSKKIDESGKGLNKKKAVAKEVIEAERKGKQAEKKIAEHSKNLKASTIDEVKAPKESLKRLYPSGDVRKVHDNSLEKIQQRVEHVKEEKKKAENVKGVIGKAMHESYAGHIQKKS
ncbi:unnamed protein product [Strongylus vulgaris]|uniref:Uncharacterized protein n=1 Tax=Strongylus vulgaris TaxID=40348 RepID=A0A3P7IJP3_STRVU|nr:unnamed protein product [Strongylus vulgaris]